MAILIINQYACLREMLSTSWRTFLPSFAVKTIKRLQKWVQWWSYTGELKCFICASHEKSGSIPTIRTLFIYGYYGGWWTGSGELAFWNGGGGGV